MNIAITDANIFIDLLKLDLIDQLFNCGYSIYTTTEVFDELHDDQQSVLLEFREQKKLTIYFLSETERALMDSSQFSKGLSYVDRTVIILGVISKALIVTGDGALRKTCQQKQFALKFAGFFGFLIYISI